MINSASHETKTQSTTRNSQHFDIFLLVRAIVTKNTARKVYSKRRTIINDVGQQQTNNSFLFTLNHPFDYISQVTVTIIMYLAISNVTAGGTHHRRVTIHVPLQIKQHHHTHTIYKHIKHHDRGYWPREDVYDDHIGYEYGHDDDNGGHGSFGHHYGPSAFESGWGSSGGGSYGSKHGYINHHYDESNWIDDK